MDIFGRFARDPSCLAAINAADGGSWRSPFRPGVVYPAAPSGTGSFEEKAGLIVKSNVKTSNGYFESAIASGLNQPANRWFVQTALNLKGRPIHGAYVFRAYMTSLPPAPTTYLSTSLCYTAKTLIYIVMQTDNTGAMTFFITIGAKTTGGGQGTLRLNVTKAQLSPYLDKWTVFVVNVDYSAKTLSFYGDGNLIATMTIGAAYLNYFYDLAGDDYFCLGAASPSINQGDYTRMKNGLLFDRPLSIGEIQILR